MPSENGNEAYVLRIWEETRRCTRELLDENGKLRELAAHLDGERKRMAEELSAISAGEVAMLSHRVVEAEAAAREAKARAQWLEHQFDSYRRRREELERRLQSMEEESRERLRSYVDLEQQNTNLANLYVASYRLHSTFDRAEVLAAIQEIIINLVGSEELAIFEVNGNGAPHLAASFGLKARSFEELGPEAREAIDRCLRTREIAVQEVDATGARPAACIPLRVDGIVVGAIAVFRLLQQKQGFESVDREMFDLLATHAATALYATTLHASRGAEVV
ncbi:MAG TPA: GAF domain-containing protein [Thermoanaerobaculia bacterium]|nr:GAF domain-containing protein [Thermoanaerobaculia bacterium]